MKVRTGLVSNSSSSSFIIATRKELPPKELKALITRAMKVPSDSPLYEFAMDIADSLAESDSMTIPEFCREHDYYGDDFVKKAIRKGFECIYEGSASSESDDATQLALVDMAFDYEDDELMIEKEAGY